MDKADAAEIPIDFNPLGRKTETDPISEKEHGNGISIHSVARPRQAFMDIEMMLLYFNPLGRKTETGRNN